MAGKEANSSPSPSDEPLTPPDPALAEAVNQLAWLIADEFVTAAQEALWLEEMLPEPKPVKVRTANKV